MPRPQDHHSYSYQLILEQREIFALAKTLERLTAEIKADTQRLRQKYDPSQPRVPRGNSDGGQWTGSGGGSEGGARLRTDRTRVNPLFHRVSDVDGDGAQDMRPKNPMERVNGPQSSPRGNNNGLTNNEATILQEEQASIRSIGKAHGRQFLKRPQIDKLTSHGNLRSQQRLPSQNEIDCAVSSAIRSGKINRQKGKYGTLSITTKAITD